MTVGDAKQKVKDFGITQLRKGETLQDALNYIDGVTNSRVGYEYKNHDGTLMSKVRLFK